MNLYEKKMELSKALQSDDGLSSNELIEGINECIRLALLEFNINLGYCKHLNFKELIKHGLENGANVVNGMPMSWRINGKTVTHERDGLYIIECISGTERFKQGDNILALEDGLKYLPYSNYDDHAPGGCPM